MAFSASRISATLLVFGAAVSVFTWFAEPVVDGALWVLPVGSLVASVVTVRGVWQRVRAALQDPEGRWARTHGSLSDAGWAGWLLLTLAGVAAVNTVGFFTGAWVAAGGSHALTGLPSLDLGVLYVLAAVTTGVLGTAALVLAVVTGDRGEHSIEA